MPWISENRYLNEAEMKNNAEIIKSYLASKGWTINSICGLLGNMESESTINPGIWQSLNENNMSGGFGLVQWTPATNYTNWADSELLSWSDGYGQLRWIDEETVSFGQWISTEAYPLSFGQFKTSSESAEYLASAFLKNFERAGVEVEAQRRSQASKWFYYFGEQPDTPTPSVPSSGKRKKFNFILFNRQRRRML